MANTPKPPGQRRRRNLGQAEWRQLPAQGRDGETPELPDGKWLDSTREWWATIWRSPMAVAWLNADVEALCRLARLRDLEAQGKMPATGYPAMQQLEDRFGLSPKARRTLQWEVVQGERASEPQAASGGSMRHLRAVDG